MEERGTIAGEFDKINASNVYRVIVVDDDPISRLVMIDMIEGVKSDRPIDIREAENGRGALRLFTMDGGADLIVTDCQMPEKNGYELTKDIRDIQDLSLYNKNPLIVMVSSLDDGEHIRKAQESGVDYVYTKANMAHMDLLQGLIENEVSENDKNSKASIETQPKNLEI